MITIDEANEFLIHQLKFANWKEVIQRNKLEFLKLLVPYYAHNIYFQNITLTSIPASERKVPDEKAIIVAGLNGIGGNCITQNSFLDLLLKSLGFDSSIISGTVHCGESTTTNNHVLVVVRLSPNELYLLDLGVGVPFPEPIPLHNLPYIHRAVGHRIMYRKSTNDFYECVQLDGTLMGEKYEDNETEFVRYDFTLNPRTIDFFNEPLHLIFTDPERSVFFEGPLLFRYFTENENGQMLDDAQLTGDRKFILIRGDDILIGTNETKLHRIVTDYEDTKATILKYFPRLSKENVEKSLDFFNKKRFV
ncbi:uncharacterized protein LOC119067116 [Bradysia coprophila]|uniref:uncharacterized protein LOC119067116 n=1 Tax=Bradysia coprophila TaxID=38358 RepID=UPI00187D793B|nr:uncharacterized protein LOC119067116 [Bradysia coprophila]